MERVSNGYSENIFFTLIIVCDFVQKKLEIFPMRKNYTISRRNSFFREKRLHTFKGHLLQTCWAENALVITGRLVRELLNAVCWCDVPVSLSATNDQFEKNFSELSD